MSGGRRQNVSERISKGGEGRERRGEEGEGRGWQGRGDGKGGKGVSEWRKKAIMLARELQSEEHTGMLCSATATKYTNTITSGTAKELRVALRWD